MASNTSPQLSNVLSTGVASPGSTIRAWGGVDIWLYKPEIVITKGGNWADSNHGGTPATNTGYFHVRAKTTGCAPGLRALYIRLGSGRIMQGVGQHHK